MWTRDLGSQSHTELPTAIRASHGAGAGQCTGTDGELLKNQPTAQQLKGGKPAKTASFEKYGTMNRDTVSAASPSRRRSEQRQTLALTRSSAVGGDVWRRLAINSLL